MPNPLSVLSLSHFDGICVVQVSDGVEARRSVVEVGLKTNDDARHPPTYILSTPSRGLIVADIANPCATARHKTHVIAVTE